MSDDRGLPPEPSPTTEVVSPPVVVVPAAGVCPRPYTGSRRNLGLPLVRHGQFLGVLDKKGDFEPVASYVLVQAMVQDPETGAWSRRLVFDARDGQTRTLVISEADFHSRPGSVIAQLAAHGLYIALGAEARGLLLEHLIRVQPDEFMWAASRPGWHEVRNEGVWVTPAATVGPAGIAEHFGLSPNVAPTGSALSDAADSQQLLRLCVGNSRMATAAAFGLAALLLRPLGEDSCCLHLVGASSSGKSTILGVVASLFGSPEYAGSWRATDNGLEIQAVHHTDAALVLNEWAELQSRLAGRTIYMLANGFSKLRATKYGGVREPLRWRVHVVSSGELGLAEKLAEVGEVPKAGMEVRFIELGCPDGGHGMFEDLHGCANGEEFAKHLKSLCETYYGHAVPRFAQHLLSQPEPLPVLLRRRQKPAAAALLEGVENASGPIGRVADRFALAVVAGDLATEAGITGWPEGEALRAARMCFADWLQARVHPADAERDVVEVVRAFILQNLALFHDPSGDNSRPPRMVGWKIPPSNASEDELGEFLILGDVFRDTVIKGLGHQAACRRLTAEGLLRSTTEGGQPRYAIKHSEARGARVYVVSARITGGIPEFGQLSRKSEDWRS